MMEIIQGLEAWQLPFFFFKGFAWLDVLSLSRISCSLMLCITLDSKRQNPAIQNVLIPYAQ